MKTSMTFFIQEVAANSSQASSNYFQREIELYFGTTNGGQALIYLGKHDHEFPILSLTAKIF